MQPTELGRYRIVRVLGRGGMGVVYEGHDPHIDRPVAIKTIALDALTDEERVMFEGRFRSEMRSTGRLQHHNIAALYDTGRDGGTAYIVMELVTGQDLKRHLSAGQRFSVGQAVDITVQLLTALEFAHRRQVVHRDVKPANVMLQADGVVKLCDFGVARLTDADATRTQGMVVGSLRYASPEQITGLPIDARTDVFSTGVLLYELLTGELPFKGQSDVEILHRIATDQAPSPRLIKPEIPQDIDGAVRRALAKDPAERFASAAEFARALGASSITSLDTLPVMPLAMATAATSATSATSATAAGSSTSATTLVTPPPRSKLPLAAAMGGGAIAAGLLVWALVRPTSAPPAVVASAPAPSAAVSVAPSVAPSMATQAPAPAPQPVAPPISGAAAPASMPAAPAAAPPPPAASAPAQPAPTVPAAAPKPALATLARPGEGLWKGQLSCSTSRTPGMTGKAAEAFKTDLTLTVAGSRLTWVRSSATYTETAAGTFDAQARFSASGEGALNDRSSRWQVQARGQFLPKSNRIEAQVQLLRPNDGYVTRDCALVAAPGGTVVAKVTKPAAGAGMTAAAPTTPTAPAAPTPKPLSPMAAVAWTGELSCGPLLNPGRTATRLEPYVAKVKLEINGSHISWGRETKTFVESASGKVEPNGRFSAEGVGTYKDAAQGGDWRVKAQGALLAGGQSVEARVQLTRAKDGSLSRECTLAAPRP